MRRFLLSIAFIFLLCNVNGQQLTVKDLLSVCSLSPQKFKNYIAKKNFVPVDRDWQNDTVVNTYRLRIKSDANDTIPVTRILETYQSGIDFSFALQTSSRLDYDEARSDLKGSGFFCSNEDDTSDLYLYQRKNISIQVNARTDPGDTLYSFHFYYKDLPSAASVRYADDLLYFTSHEYLVSVFGEKNVKKDLYYFSEKEITKCSVLFPYTKRQAVFIWGDEANLSELSYILIGGNLPTKSSISYNNVVAENSWTSKEGVYSGMSLRNLARLNESDFRFYGKNSEFPLMVVPENTGKINFKKNVVVLSSLSNSSSRILDNNIVKVNDALQEGPGLFVLMYMLSPTKRKNRFYQAYFKYFPKKSMVRCQASFAAVSLYLVGAVSL